MKYMPVGVDIAKNVFQVHFMEEKTGEAINKQLKRARFLKFFEGRAPCLVGMEACGGAHEWARQLSAMGHKVKLHKRPNIELQYIPVDEVKKACCKE